MKNGSFNSEDLQTALSVLRRGGVILYPTDTIWGIGCDATKSEAVKRIFALKQRADSKAMLVLMDSADRLAQYVDIPEAAASLLEATEEGRPMTIIYPNACGVAPELIAEDGSIGIRITHEAFSNALCRELGKPIVSTSANISGEASPANFAQISSAIIDGVDYVCRFRQNDNTPKQASAIIKIHENNTFNIIRA
ncbi:MAG: threonylcarbamoyl-AMP synthase [Paludibacteraceae bacterium]|nr:threonylcarbamoyl-AMP synthase [Paludibacteraceae bacterium]